MFVSSRVLWKQNSERLDDGSIDEQQLLPLVHLIDLGLLLKRTPMPFGQIRRMIAENTKFSTQPFPLPCHKMSTKLCAALLFCRLWMCVSIAF